MDISNAMAVVTKQLKMMSPQMEAVVAASKNAMANYNGMSKVLEAATIPLGFDRFKFLKGESSTRAARVLSRTSPATNDTTISVVPALAIENAQLRQKYASETKARQALESENAKLRSEVEQLRKPVPPPEPQLSVSENLAKLRQRVVSDNATIARWVDALEIEGRMEVALREESTASMSPQSGWGGD